jgi:hypothetical protein
LALELGRIRGELESRSGRFRNVVHEADRSLMKRTLDSWRPLLKHLPWRNGECLAVVAPPQRIISPPAQAQTQAQDEVPAAMAAAAAVAVAAASPPTCSGSSLLSANQPGQIDFKLDIDEKDDSYNDMANTGLRATAISDYDAKSEDELSFKQGDTLFISGEGSDQYYLGYFSLSLSLSLPPSLSLSTHTHTRTHSRTYIYPHYAYY